MPLFRTIPLIITASLMIMAPVAMACSVPVFRYALEHWPSDPYQAIVFKSTPLTQQEHAWMRRLGTSGKVAVQSVDPTSAGNVAVVELWKKAGSPPQPWLVIKTPHALPQQPPAWSGSFDESHINAVLDSPARTELARRIGDGESAVWLLLESGDKTKDDAAAKVLESRLAYLGSVLALPKLDDQDIKNGLVSVPEEGLKLAFSVLRLNRKDPAEQALVSMLLATEKDLNDQHEPIAFPVFGQARVLYALVGKGINHETIDTAANFLIGSCSCQVKEMNPGTDLLMTVDWKKVLKDQATGAQDLPKVSDIVSTMPETVTITARPKDAADEPCCPTRAWIDEHRVLTVSIAAPLLFLMALLLIRKTR